MEHIQYVYGFLKYIVIAIIMLYKIRKTMLHSLDGVRDFFDIDTGELEDLQIHRIS